MAKAVFVQSSHAHYRDVPGERYHFPKRNYLSVVAQAVGDWVVFYEGRRGDGRGYYAVGQVEKLVDDPTDASHAFALLVPGNYIDFPTPLSRERPDGRLWETGLARMGGNNTSAVRLLPETDFAAIITAGLDGDKGDPLVLDRDPGRYPEPAAQPPLAAFEPRGAAPLPPGLSPERPRVLIDRAARDRAFSLAVKRAYGGRCAVSGLSLRNGGGRPEVEAAHIRPVGAAGPDAVSNGLALSGTVHWMFDRGLISAEDDGKILIARGAVPAEVRDRLIRPEGALVLPARAADRPHPAFLQWHRDHVFKG